MKSFIIGLSPAAIKWFFGSAYAIAVLLAIFPPLYLWGSGSNFLIFGLPFAIAYWIIDALIICFALAGLYYTELVRGELDKETQA